MQLAPFIIAQLLFGWILYDARIQTQLSAEQNGAIIVKSLATAIKQKVDNFVESVEITDAPSETDLGDLEPKWWGQEGVNSSTMAGQSERGIIRRSR